MAENLQATLFQYALSAHANDTSTNGWSHDQLTQKAYFHSKWGCVTGIIHRMS